MKLLVFAEPVEAWSRYGACTFDNLSKQTILFQSITPTNTSYCEISALYEKKLLQRHLPFPKLGSKWIFWAKMLHLCMKVFTAVSANQIAHILLMRQSCNSNIPQFYACGATRSKSPCSLYCFFPHLSFAFKSSLVSFHFSQPISLMHKYHNRYSVMCSVVTVLCLKFFLCLFKNFDNMTRNLQLVTLISSLCGC